MTGILENPSNLLDECALVSPGQLTAPTQVTILVGTSHVHGLPAVAPCGGCTAADPLWLADPGPRAAHCYADKRGQGACHLFRCHDDTKSGELGLGEISDGATAFGILLTLGVLVMTVGLIRSEAAGDLRTLTAVGASSGIRRTIVGATADLRRA